MSYKKKEYAETHKEEIKKYQDNYREENREKLKIEQNKKVSCPTCNKMISKTNLKRHIITQH